MVNIALEARTGQESADAASAAGNTKEALVRDFRTKSIVAAAQTVVAEQGFHGASLDMIAEEAGISKGTIYLYFENKEALFVQAIEDGHHHTLQQARLAIAEVDSASERLHAAINAFMSFSHHGQDLFKAYMMEKRGNLFSNEDDPGFQRLVELRKESHSLIEGILRQGIEEGDFRAVDVETTTAFLVEIFSGVALQKMWGLIDESPTSIADTVHDLLMGGLMKLPERS